MSKFKQYTPPQTHFNETVSFGAHRHYNKPASAIRAGASSMPPSWQSRATPTRPSALQGNHDVLNVTDMLASPLVWCIRTRIGRLLTSLVAAMGLIALFL